MWFNCKKQEGASIPTVGLPGYSKKIPEELLKELNKELEVWFKRFTTKGNTTEARNSKGTPYITFTLRFRFEDWESALTIFKRNITEEYNKTKVISIRKEPEITKHGTPCPRCGQWYVLRTRLVSYH